jgi:predicted dehydrogenase
MAVEGKLTVYDKGFDEKVDTYGEYITRSGDIWSPVLPNAEPLRLECEHFIESIRTGTAPLSDGESGLRVVRVLEGLQNDLEASRRTLASRA